MEAPHQPIPVRDARGCEGSGAGPFLRASSLLERHAANVRRDATGSHPSRLRALIEPLAGRRRMRLTSAPVAPWLS